MKAKWFQVLLNKEADKTCLRSIPGHVKGEVTLLIFCPLIAMVS